MDQAIGKFLGYFSNPTLTGIGIAVLFGALWLLAYWPPMRKMKSLWLMLLGGAVATLLASAFIQVPLNDLARSLLSLILTPEGVERKVLLAGLFYVLIGGLVQEGAKLLPVFVLWLRREKKLAPMAGLFAGALAGLGFAVIEAQWVHNVLFAAGWNWEALQAGNYTSLLTFWERLVMVGLHTALGALMGYGLATKKGWRNYLLAAFIHALASYAAYLLTDGLMSILVAEVYLTAVTAVLAVIMLSLRWEEKGKKTK